MALDDAKAYGNASARSRHPEELSLPGSATRFVPRTPLQEDLGFLEPAGSELAHMHRIRFVRRSAHDPK